MSVFGMSLRATVSTFPCSGEALATNPAEDANGVRKVRPGAFFLVRCLERQLDPEAGAPAGLGAAGDAAVVRLRDRPCDREPEPRPGDRLVGRRRGAE